MVSPMQYIDPHAHLASHWYDPWLETVRTWVRRSHDRRALARLSDRELRDLGVTRYDVAVEAGKPFWRSIDLRG